MNKAELRSLYFSYAVWLFGSFVFFIPAATWSPSSRFALTRAVVERHTFSIDAYASSTGDRALVSGQWFSEKAPLPSLVAVAPYAVLHMLQSLRRESPTYRAHSSGQIPAVRMEVNRAYQQGLFLSSALTSGLAGAAAGLLMLELLRRRTRLPAAVLGSMFVTLGTPVFAYATSFYGHTPAAALLLGAMVCLDPRGTPKGFDISRNRLRWAGVCLAFAPGCEYMSAVPAAILGAAFLFRSPRRLHAALNLAAGAFAPFVIVAAYHWLSFGAPWHTGYSFITNPQFRDGQSKGLLGITSIRPEALYGLTFGVSRGLFFIAPVALVGVVLSARRAIVRSDWCAQTGLVGLFVLFLLNASYFVWWGGAAVGPRHLVPALGVLALGLGDALNTRSSVTRYATIALGVCSIFNVVSLTLVGLEAPELGNVLTQFAWPNLLSGHVSILQGASNVGFRLGLDGPRAILLFATWFIGGIVYIFTHLRPVDSIGVGAREEPDESDQSALSDHAPADGGTEPPR